MLEQFFKLQARMLSVSVFTTVLTMIAMSVSVSVTFAAHPRALSAKLCVSMLAFPQDKGL